MADDAKTLQERRRDLLRRRIAESGLAAGRSAPAIHLQAGERYRLSTGQRRMWFLQAMDADDTTLNICVAYRLSGALDEARLRAAVGEIMARHAILRTTYGVNTEGEPYQVFQDTVEIPWQAIDLNDHSVDELARREFGRPFDLANDPPLRLTLIRTAPGEFVMLLVVHHICWDDDAWDVFFTELSAAYNAQSPADPAPQFVAIEVLGGTDEPSMGDVGYWADELRPAPEPLELPGVPAAHPTRRAERVNRAFPDGLFDRLEQFARQHAASPFMVLLAAYGVLVRRYTGASDFLVSVPVTERKAAAEKVIGYFGNTLLLRLTARPGDTFNTYVDAVRDTCLDGFAHQSVGIDRVVREANPERMGHDGMDQLVRLGFSMRKSVSGFTLDGVDVRQLDLGAVTAHLPLALAIVLNPDGAVTEFEYQTDVLGAALVDQMAAHYLALLDNAIAEPDRRLASLDMLGVGERATVLDQSHGELVPTPPTTMVAVLEAAADGRPDAVALVSDDARLTYAELHGRANRLARWIIGQGLGAEDVVGLRFATSIEFLVTMLAVLKSGAAYLPIDPAYPDDRVEYLIADARPQLVLGRQEFDAAELQAQHLSDAAVTDADRRSALRPEQLAYVIYTSGSTGQPKGVAVSHHAIAEHVEGFVAEWSMTAEDRLLQSSSVSFDASLLDIFVTLSLGAQLVVPKPDAFSDIPYVADLISRHDITVLHMVPSMLSTLLLLPQVKEWRQLRHVPVGGEALAGEVADKFAGYFDAQLRNHYGPTEAVVCSTHMVVDGSHGVRVVPIGVPNRNVYAYVLDEELQPVPAEVIGELYLGGEQLARCYLGRPGLTSQRFVADPFNPGKRLYRTGDLVRRNISGELEFVGRADEQVKVRGYRIELGEVESVVATHPAVRHCLVVAEDTGAGPMLAAYLVPAGAHNELNLDDVRTHAAATLPEYMVPSAFAVIPEIPLTVSGKLDKRALPAPTPVAVRSYREPATETERRMCAIFARLFGWEKVGAEDSFFGLGGHSLLAARLVAQIRAEFGVELTVRAVFDTPTPAGLATRLVEQFRNQFGVDLDRNTEMSMPHSSRPQLAGELDGIERPERPPLSYSQFAMWFQYRMRGGNDVFNMALTLRFSGPLNRDALAAALNDVVARHEALRTNFVEHENVPYQFVHPSRELDLSVRAVEAGQFDETVAQLRGHVFALESDLLVRATLLVLDPDTCVLVLLVHHIVTDHTSLGILFEDLLTAYRARLQQNAPRWPTSPVPFVNFALWQQEAFHPSNEWGEAELAHWSKVLGGMPFEISLGADHTRPPVLGRRGEVANFTVPPHLRAALTQLAERHDASEFMVYQAATAVVLHKLGGGTDIPIGSPIAARIDVATNEINGPCANVVVLRNDLSDDPTLLGMVARSRDVVLDALAHQELPVERVVEALNPPRSPSRNHPLFQTSIHFHGEDWALMARDLTGDGQTRVTPIPMDFEISILDLNIVFALTPDSEVKVRVVGNADLYEPATVRLIADALEEALKAFAATPDSPVSSVRLLAEVDQQRLLEPASSTATQRSHPVIGGSEETERALIALLEELLEITDIDREDNFFALGGDSIISVQWSARASAQGLIMTPAMVFENMTIAELAAAVDAGAGQAAPEQPAAPSAPMSASGLDADALAALTASWNEQP